MSEVVPPRGMRDVLPEDFFLREQLTATIRRVYESYGYVPIDTPAPERIEVLTSKAGSETEQLMFKILRRGQGSEQAGELADMGLRYDLTVPLCRFYASNHARLPAVFRRYQIAPVWRADRPQRGRLREFYQCDVDVIGLDGLLAECEVIAATVETLRALGIADAFVRLSDRRILPTLLRTMGLGDEAIRKAMVSVDKLDKIQVEGVLRESQDYLPPDLHARFGELVTRLAETGRTTPVSLDVLGPWGAQAAGTLGPVLANLERITAILRESSCMAAPLDIGFSPAMVRGMAYYTGPIFEIWNGADPFSLAGGGRYDGLVGHFLGRSLPACGFSIGFERILTILRDRARQGAPLRPSRAEVLVGLRAEGLESVGLRLGRQLRQEGIATEIYPFTANIKKQFKHATDLGIPWILNVPDPDGASLELIDGRTRERFHGSWSEVLAELRTRRASAARR